MQLLAKCIEEFGKRHLKLAKDLEEQMVTGSHRDPELLRKVLKDILIESVAGLHLSQLIAYRFMFYIRTLSESRPSCD